MDDKTLAKLGDQVPDLIKNNKGALIGALIGYALSDNEQAKSALLGAVAGAVLTDGDDDAEKEE